MISLLQMVPCSVRTLRTLERGTFFILYWIPYQTRPTCTEEHRRNRRNRNRFYPNLPIPSLSRETFGMPYYLLLSTSPPPGPSPTPIGLRKVKRMAEKRLQNLLMPMRALSQYRRGARQAKNHFHFMEECHPNYCKCWVIYYSWSSEPLHYLTKLYHYRYYLDLSLS